MSNNINKDNRRSTSNWKIHPSKLRTGRCCCGGVAIDDHRIVIIGGSDGNTTLSSVELFDSRATGGTTQQLSQMNDARFGHASIVHMDYIYVIGGGLINSMESSVERININNINTSKWNMIAPMKKKRIFLAADKNDNHIYVFGGLSGRNAVGTSERYDIRKNKWDFISPMKQPRYAHAAVTVGDKVYIFGGQGKFHNHLVSMEIFDIQSQRWEDDTGVDMPMALAFMKTVVLNQRIIVIGGTKWSLTSNGLKYDQILIYDTQTNLWTTDIKVTMNIPHRRFGTTVLKNDTIFVVGGGNQATNGLDILEYANIYDLILIRSSEELGRRSTDRTRQNEESSEQPTYHQTASNMVPVKVEEDGGVHESILRTSTIEKDLTTNHRNKSPTYSSSKTLLERVKFLEKSFGQKENSSIFKRRVEYLETNIFGKVLSSENSIVKRIKRLENEFT